MNSTHSDDVSDIPFEQELMAFRAQIDAIDRQIIEILGNRAAIVRAVGQAKARAGMPAYRPEREVSMIQSLKEINKGPLSNDAIESIYRVIISECLALERRLAIGYLGPEGTFSQMALDKCFGPAVQSHPFHSIDAVFEAVQSSSVDFGVVPIENSTAGSVGKTLDLLLTSDLTICREISLTIAHCAINQSGTLAEVQRVLSHPQSLAQCSAWLEHNMPGIPQIAVESNAKAAFLASEDKGVLAIAGQHAAERYGLMAVKKDIQDEKDNRTRFVVIGRYACSTSGYDQTSIVVAVPDKPGAVHQLIEPFARNGVSMKRFESRPARQPGWSYYFYIDLLGHVSDPAMATALEMVSQQASFYRLLGSYPRDR